MTSIAGDLTCRCGRPLTRYESGQGHFCENCDRLQPQETVVVRSYEQDNYKIEVKGERVVTDWDKQAELTLAHQRLDWYGDEIEKQARDLGGEWKDGQL